MPTPHEKLADSLTALRKLQESGRRVFQSEELSRLDRERLLRNGFLHEINIGRRSPAFPVTPPGVRVRTGRFGGFSYRPPVNLGIPSESK